MPILPKSRASNPLWTRETERFLVENKPLLGTVSSAARNPVAIGTTEVSVPEVVVSVEVEYTEIVERGTSTVLVIVTLLYDVKVFYNP